MNNSNNNKMCFCGYIWNNNPSNVKIEHTRLFNDDIIPYSKSVLQDVAIKRRIISGNGEFFGENCFEQFNKLYEIFEKGQSGILYIPNIININAKLYSLEVTKTNIKDVIEYKFIFWEDYCINNLSNNSFVTAQNECLWDIANKLNINIDNLIALNPSIKRPDLILKNTEVCIL